LQPSIQKEDSKAFILDQKIRITQPEAFFEPRDHSKSKKVKPLIPAHFKSIIKKDTPMDLKIVTMKKILVDKL